MTTAAAPVSDIISTKSLSLGDAVLVLNKHRSAPSQIRMLIDGNEIGIFMPQLDLMDRQIGWELVDAKSMRVAGVFKTADEVSRWLRSAHLALFIALGQVVKA